MLCHRLVLPDQLGRRIRTRSTLAVRTQPTSGANFVTTVSEGPVPTSRGYSDRNRAVRKDNFGQPTLHYSTDNTRMTMHKKEKQNFHDRFPPSPYLGSWVISAYTTFFWILFPSFFFKSPSFFFFHFRTKEEWSSGSRSLDLALFFLGWGFG